MLVRFQICERGNIPVLCLYVLDYAFHRFGRNGVEFEVVFANGDPIESQFDTFAQHACLTDKIPEGSDRRKFVRIVRTGCLKETHPFIGHVQPNTLKLGDSFLLAVQTFRQVHNVNAIKAGN